MRMIRSNHQCGFSLVELMVALVIGLVIMLGATQLFITSKGGFDRVEALAERQETLRFLVDTVSLDVRTAASMSRAPATSSDPFEYLQLDFGSNRPDDPYCSGGEKLAALRYQYDGDSSSVRVKVLCGSEMDWSAKSFQPIVGGVASLDADVDDVDGLDADIMISLLPLPGESSPQYKFRVANRGAVTSRVAYK